MQQVPVAPPVQIHVEAPVAPPPPPKPSVAKSATPRGNSNAWVTTDDYPQRALREEKEGVTTIRFDINAEGRVENCRVGESSGTPDLDDAACRNYTRRARYTPAQDAAGNKIAELNQSRRIRWQIPK
jgi:protein TonB